MVFAHIGKKIQELEWALFVLLLKVIKGCKCRQRPEIAQNCSTLLPVLCMLLTDIAVLFESAGRIWVGAYKQKEVNTGWEAMGRK